MLRRPMLVLALTLAALAPQRSVAQTYLTVPGVTYTATSITNAMLASQLVGMPVEVRFSDGTTSGGTWAFLGIGMDGPRYGVTNALFSFSAFGAQDTGGPSISLNDFNLANFNPSGETIVGLMLHGAPAGAVFDRTFGGLAGTAGSGAGRDVIEALNPGSNEFDMIVTYRDHVTLAGGSPVGDLFAALEIAFGNGVPEEENYSLFLDTDVASGLTTVPEPATGLLLGTGLVLMAAIARRGARKARNERGVDA